MSNNKIIIIGGDSFTKEVEEVFNKHDIDIIHYDGRNNSSIKKQKIPINTIGAIITINRSHMVFGNGNELVRELKDKNIPFIFLSGHFASITSANSLLEKIKEVYPDKVKEIKRVNKHEIKFENIKKELEIIEKKFLNLENQYKDTIIRYDNKLLEWSNILDDWKFFLLELKEKEESLVKINKKYKQELDYSYYLKEKVHDEGIYIESRINVLEFWKKLLINKEYKYLLENFHKLKNDIFKLVILDNKEAKNNFKEWKDSFFIFENKLNTIIEQLNEISTPLESIINKIENWEILSKEMISTFKLTIKLKFNE